MKTRDCPIEIKLCLVFLSPHKNALVLFIRVTLECLRNPTGVGDQTVSILENTGLSLGLYIMCDIFVRKQKYPCTAHTNGINYF